MVTDLSEVGPRMYSKHTLNTSSIRRIQPGTAVNGIFEDKLMLNSFFGRWGLKETTTESELMSWDEYYKLLNERQVKNTWVVPK